jgi:SMC interacting uncharacterized protein involved in chromosome segregation
MEPKKCNCFACQLEASKLKSIDGSELDAARHTIAEQAAEIKKLNERFINGVKECCFNERRELYEKLNNHQREEERLRALMLGLEQDCSDYKIEVRGLRADIEVYKAKIEALRADESYKNKRIELLGKQRSEFEQANKELLRLNNALLDDLQQVTAEKFKEPDIAEQTRRARVELSAAVSAALIAKGYAGHAIAGNTNEIVNELIAKLYE